MLNRTCGNQVAALAAVFAHASERMTEHDTIAVIDFGGQYAHLIATRVRRLGVRAEIRQPDDGARALAGYRGVIISGSPALSSQDEESGYDRSIFDLPVPILGLCFGHQEIASHYGGRVVHGKREWGRAELHLTAETPLFRGLDSTEQVWMSHFDSVVAVGPDFTETGYTSGGSGHADHRFAAIASEKLGRYGLQFHPEVAGTRRGTRILENFALGICGCTPSWSADTILEATLARARRDAGGRSVFLLASGGVDSTVAAVLLGKALGSDRVHLLHIDNGLMRRGESDRVLARFRELELGANLNFVDASSDFLAALEGLVDPEAKRRAIGDTFVAVQAREAERLGLARHLLAQGTIYPDTIETGGTKRADTIKTHHNRVPAINEMIARGEVIEPLAELYKVEVRELGARLGIDPVALSRHPFPGPGLGVRLLCSDGANDEEPELTEAAEQVARRFGLRALALPVRSVGVKADKRSFEHPVLLSSGAGGIAGALGPGWDPMLAAVSEITAEIPGVNRCILNLGLEHPARARPVAGTVTKERLETLREADAIVMNALVESGIHDAVWQCPTVLVPVVFDPGGRDADPTGRDLSGRVAGETIVLRPVNSERAMTAAPVRLPPELAGEIACRLLALEGVGAVALDVTSKPPGTIEWE